MKGKLIVFDGIDGSGKTTVIAAAINFLKKRKNVFDLVAWSKKNHALPEAATFKPYGVILSAEPTHTWVGAAIRAEIIRAGGNYTGKDAAAAFALDRKILYTRCIIPALSMGKLVLQDRSISSSIAYQPIQKNPAPLEFILSLTGNKLALNYPPNAILIASCPPEIALERLRGRKNKKDDVIFEQLAFMKKLSARFHAAWYKKFWEKRGTKIVYLNTEQSKNEVARQAIAAISPFLIRDS